MWTIAEVKERGRLAFKANYWSCVIVSLIYALLLGGGMATSGSNTAATTSGSDLTLTEEQATILAVAVAGVVGVAFIISLIVKIFLTNPVEVGSARFFKKNLEEKGVGVGILREGFGDYGRVFVTLFLRDLFIGLFTLLLIVPGIMKAYSYRLVPYIVKDNPNLTASQVLRRSEELMRGNRWQTFMLDLSFIGWVLLGIVTLGIGLIFWTAPYMHSTEAALYKALSE